MSSSSGPEFSNHTLGGPGQFGLKEKIKFFLWLLIQNRLWTADRLRARAWPHNDKCLFCDQTIESARHLFLKCPYAKEVWFLFSQENERVARAAGATTVKNWWLQLTRGQRTMKSLKRGYSGHLHYLESLD